jgi:thioredoxin-like negative regulator of GroEL
MAHGVGAAEKGAELFRAGEARLATGDLTGAMQQFAGAVRADANNAQYVQQYAVVRQVLMIRASLPTEKNAAQWDYKARALHAFYVSHGLYSDALEIGEQLHAKVNTGASALLLAETRLAMNQPEAAAEVLGALPADKHTVTTKSLHGLAIARHGDTQQAERIAREIQLGSDDGPGAVYALARLQAAIGDVDQACRLLVRCFEGTAPSRLAGFKQHAQRSPEFASLATNPAFVAALQTESKIPESSCSGGSSCASCPMRGNCSGGQ